MRTDTTNSVQWKVKFVLSAKVAILTLPSHDTMGIIQLQRLIMSSENKKDDRLPGKPGSRDIVESHVKPLWYLVLMRESSVWSG